MRPGRIYITVHSIVGVLIGQHQFSKYRNSFMEMVAHNLYVVFLGKCVIVNVLYFRCTLMLFCVFRIYAVLGGEEKVSTALLERCSKVLENRRWKFIR